MEEQFEDQYEEAQRTYSRAELEAFLEADTRLLEANEYHLTLAEAMSRLVKNPDFELVFNEYYQKDYLNKLVEDYASSISPDLQESSASKVRAIGVFRNFVKGLLKSKNETKREIEYLKDKINLSNSMLAHGE